MTRYVQEKPEWAKRGKRCPCGAPETHYGMSDGIALTMGCNLCMRRWVRGGTNPGRVAVNGFRGDE